MSGMQNVHNEPVPVTATTQSACHDVFYSVEESQTKEKQEGLGRKFGPALPIRQTHDKIRRFAIRRLTDSLWIVHSDRFDPFDPCLKTGQ